MKHHVNTIKTWCTRDSAGDPVPGFPQWVPHSWAMVEYGVVSADWTDFTASCTGPANLHKGTGGRVVIALTSLGKDEGLEG